MEKPRHHIFVCCSYRVGGEPKGKCSKKDPVELIGYMESELPDRGLDDVLVSSAGCMKLCDHSPVMVVYPEGYWYGGVDCEDAVDEILDALADGGAADKYLLT
jgi:(2Fe-2S) ferredoxin